jgi:hypothetical protein
MIIVLIIVFAVIFFISGFYFYKNNWLAPEILSIESGVKYLTNCGDEYFRKFRDLDWKVRGVKNLDEYITNIEKSVLLPTLEQKQKILNSIELCNKYLDSISLQYFNGEKYNKIVRWRIVLIDGKAYEGGLPHTRGNVIVLPVNIINSGHLVTTLIHERIHVLQRLYPIIGKKFIELNNYTKYKHLIDTRARINPDIDNYIYKDKNGRVNIAEYKKGAKSIHDVLYRPIPNDQRSEHPYENMAITIANGWEEYKNTRQLYG